MHRLHANSATSYKGLEHPQIGVSVGGPGTNPPRYQGMTAISCSAAWHVVVNK